MKVSENLMNNLNQDNQLFKMLGIEQSMEEFVQDVGEQPPKKKRKRRTKKEMEEARLKELQEEEIDVFDDRPEWEKRQAHNFDEFCQWEMDKAKAEGLEQPDFDFRNIYDKGSIVYLVRRNRGITEADSGQVGRLIPLTLRTIYPRCLIGIAEGRGCEVIGFNERDNVFSNRMDANDFIEVMSQEV